MNWLARLRRIPAAQGMAGAYLVVAAGLLARFLAGAKRPSETRWDERIAEGKLPGFLDYLHVGLWWGGIAHLAIVLVLIASAPLWMRWTLADPVKVRLGRPSGGAVPVSARWFLIGLVALMVAAIPSRFARLDDSFWGDEAWASERYSHGFFAPGPDGPQGELEFEVPSWARTFFDDRGGGSNHQLQTLTGRLIDHGWRRIAGLPRHEVVEWPMRVPALVTGIAAVAMVGLLLRRLGYPLAGLAAAAILAMHPWHIRYSSEARGYGPMLFFLFATMWALVGALRRGRWRDWTLFAALELLTAYAWKGAPFPLLAINIVAAVAIVLSARGAPGGRALSGGLSALSRLTVVNLIIAGIFIHLYGPSHLQISDFWQRTTFLKGSTFSAPWAKEYLGYLAVGADFFDRFPIMPVPFSVESAWGGRGWVAATIAAACGCVVLAGVVHGMRTSPRAALLVMAPLLAVGLGLMHFWIGLESGLLTYYVYYGLAGVILLAGLGVEGIGEWAGRGRPRRAKAVVAAAVAGYAVAALPVVVLLVEREREPLRQAWELTRGRHEEAGYHGPSQVRTIYHWRHARLYDPRAEMHARDAEAIRRIMDQARAADEELYMVVGNLMHMEEHQSDVMELARDPRHFEALAEFWTYHPVTSLAVFRMVPAPAGPGEGGGAASP